MALFLRLGFLPFHSGSRRWSLELRNVSLPKISALAAELPVMETFYTIQGEGAHAGAPAWFIRLGGCDVGCFWCDVKESWDPEVHPKRSIEDIADQAADSGAQIAVVTGGEPCMHNLTALTQALHERGMRTHLETSGAHPLTGDWDWLTLSPKKFKPARDEFYAAADELKVIVYNRHDLEWGQGHSERLTLKAQRFFQPEWEERDSSIPMILNYIREHTEWRISLQTHKYIGIP